MAKKNRESGTSRSQAIRDALAKDPNAGPKAIIEELAKDGIEVTSGLVSVVKTSLNKGKKRGRKKKVAQKSSDMVSMTDLRTAKKLADQLGGVAKAREAMDALAKLTD